MIRPISTYRVVPSLPPELERLQELAYNLFWSWDHGQRELFMRMDPELWERSQHNPVKMIGDLAQERLAQLATDESFLAQMKEAWERYSSYMKNHRGWMSRVHQLGLAPFVGYFCAEFGLAECLSTYSGGLGILSGDHLKSASDLSVPLAGVGLFYQEGYFHQYLNADGWQQELYPDNDFYTTATEVARGVDREPLTISVSLPGRDVRAQIWRLQIGRLCLYLLDTNIPGNAPEDHDISDQLYGGDREMRLKQEILLGIGGYRALGAVGLAPEVFHLNEGHSAFLTLERCRELVRDRGLSFAEAREATSAGTVFTTHTPVPAGNDYFAPDLIERYFGDFRAELGLSREEFLALGRRNPEDKAEEFCMTVLALRMAGHRNGVSELHGQISRRMWQSVWPGTPVEDVPIRAIANGVHAPTWISRDMAGLFDRYLGPRWRDDPDNLSVWNRVDQIPNEELWHTHERRRERLVAFARRRLRQQLKARGAPPFEVAQADEVLNPEALTIGFARRFATYKRGTLLLRDPERLARILTNKDCPVQVIFAGKAHPRDNPGKELIRQIIHFARRPEIRRRVVFLEDYDISLARYLVQGVDVWLNTPRRPLEASGTSGMKATFNGALNLSILDGWWAELYDPSIGWAIGQGEEYADERYQDEVESNGLYDLLEKDVVPLFYTRGPDGLPRHWITRMKASIRGLGPRVNTNRMVREYTEDFYLPALARSRALAADGFARARALAAWKVRIREAWTEVNVLQVVSEERASIRVGDPLKVAAWLALGRLVPAELSVDLLQGPIDGSGIIVNPRLVPMEPTGAVRDGGHEFAGSIRPETSGRHGYAVRVTPRHPDLDQAGRLDLVRWADGSPA